MVKKMKVTEVHGREDIWGVGTLCYLCAFNLDDRPLYLATLLSFVYAFGHFFAEFLMEIRNLITVAIFAADFSLNLSVYSMLYLLHQVLNGF
ncbi:PREDICTED: ergosterol biosynthetic protein 28-like [Ipomoea nil]|uniref:ergosterol biosynthetic protein 28-like n=1 Tax=Ipomoea nil TaxID=35883 RepID=UPI000900CC62|nr:PREDICTED: ergosterol biosynthetic protein 28-like [Ipomoea nil]